MKKKTLSHTATEISDEAWPVSDRLLRADAGTKSGGAQMGNSHPFFEK